jgi:hypothetical protein
MFGKIEDNKYSFKLKLYHHKIEDEFLEDLDSSIEYKPTCIHDDFIPTEDASNYIVLDAFYDIQAFDKNYVEDKVYCTLIDIEVSNYTNYMGEADQNIYSRILSHEVISDDVDKWYKENVLEKSYE